MPSKPVQSVPASALRDWYNADPKRIQRLPEAARVSVQRREDGKMPRGRVHPLAQKDHNKRRPSAQYVTGNTNAAKAASKAEAVALRAAAAEAGVSVGKRGPLSKAALAALKG